MDKIRNFEFKAICTDSNKKLETLEKLGAVYKGEDIQVDTYFKTSEGRLKLREGNIENTLIFYNRSNEAKARNSEIYLERLPLNNNIKNILKHSYGIKVVVAKRRKIFFIDHVKFHVDELNGLGNFFEVEVIDTTGKLSTQEMSETCEKYKKIFEVKDVDILSESYSDMILKSKVEIENMLQQKAQVFLGKLDHFVSHSELDLKNFELDHLCYRVESDQAYLDWKDKLSVVGEMLIEANVNGRKIATFELYEPIALKDRRISLLELPAPKAKSFYKEGFEHAEFVIDLSFDKFEKKYAMYEFDKKAIDKKINPDIKLSFDGGAIKFHHQSLDQIIKEELLLSSSSSSLSSLRTF